MTAEAMDNPSPPPEYSLFDKPAPVVMLEAPAPTAPQNSSPKIPLSVATSGIDDLQQVVTEMEGLLDPEERRLYIKAHKEHIRKTSKLILQNTLMAYRAVGREIGCMVDEGQDLGDDHTQSTVETLEKGECIHRQCGLYTCLDKELWAKRVACEMSFNCQPPSRHDCCLPCPNACCCYWSSVGTWAIPVSIAAFGALVSQGICYAVSAPCRCEWKPKKTKKVYHLDTVTPKVIKAFIAQMNALHEGLN
jgi:hypothetical protein